MTTKTKKAQIVLAALDQASHTFFFLLLKTNERRGSFWQNVTGKLEDEETYEEGGLREAIEETALKVDDIVEMINLGLSYDFTDQHGRKVHEESFLIILDQKWDIQIDPHEHADFAWLEVSKLSPDCVKYESNYETLVKAQKLLKHWGR